MKLYGYPGRAMFALAGLIQLVPYGRAHDNPPVTRSAPWPNAESEALAWGTCYDCHSHEKVRPWYRLVQSDVDEGPRS